MLYFTILETCQLNPEAVIQFYFENSTKNCFKKQPKYFRVVNTYV